MSSKYQGTADEKRALDAYIKLSRATDTVSHAVNAHLQEWGLTTSQFGVLEALYHLGPLPVGKVGEKILKSSGNMTLVVDNLEKRGLVERERRDDDRRSVELRLTDAGRSLVAGILPGHVSGVVHAFSILSPAEQQMLAELCRKLGLSQAEQAETVSRSRS